MIVCQQSQDARLPTPYENLSRHPSGPGAGSCGDWVGTASDSGCSGKGAAGGRIL